MTGLLIIIAAVLALCFGFVVLFGAPYVPTLSPQVEAAFVLLDLKPGQTMLELGCGDGRVLIAAAERGIKVVGYELNPLLVVVCWLRTRRYRSLVTIRMADFWHSDWPKADAIYGFILPRLMSKLDTKIQREKRSPIRVVSFAFMIPGRKPIAEQAGVYLYDYK